MMRKRLSRQEKQAHTRTCLMTSAAKIFARRGLDQASIDEMAADAGYTKGAFYANFKNKEELFLAMLDQRFSERLGEMDRAVNAGGTVEEQARVAGNDFARAIASDPEWERLFFEFCAYAARNEDFRQELSTRNRTLRARVADLFVTSDGETAPTKRSMVERVTLMTCAMASGVALEKLLDPEAVPDELYAEMLTIFFTGLRAMKEGQAPVATAVTASAPGDVAS